ncbi:MAG: hypothetical protein GY940_24290, partial [bacterium]|nr:hypothetical protein [bacterium]
TEEDFQQSLDLVTELKDVIWQAEPSPFRYYYTGQVDSDQWAGLRMPLYPEDSRDLLVSQTWVLDTRPQWEEIARRVNRFVRHCMDLGVPNPYSLHEIYKADERWKRLHQNAVPSLLELKKTGGLNMNVDERKHVKKLIFAQTPSVDDSQFDQFEF